jgi:DNA polymerase-3 subunit delta'
MSVHPDDFPPVLSELQRIINTRKIPNALLFTGAFGSGRKQAAFWFAKAANCSGTHGIPCGLCRSCRKIDAGQHPDMLVVSPAEPQKPITISRVREIIARTGTRPHEAAYRMVLITDAGQMNVQAQNALLKELEEPPQNTFFILMARERAGLLPTILSRCRTFRFPPLSGPAMAAHLAAHYRIGDRWAGIVAATAGTDLNLAATLALAPENTAPATGANRKTDPAEALDWRAVRTWLIRETCRLISGPVFRKIPTALGLSGFLSRHPDRIGPGLAIMRTFFRDLCMIRHAPEKLVNTDFSEQFRQVSGHITDTDVLLWMDELHETEKRLFSNSSIRMTLDRFFLKLTDLQGNPP